MKWLPAHQSLQLSIPGCLRRAMLGEATTPREVRFGSPAGGLWGWQGLTVLLWSNFSQSHSSHLHRLAIPKDKDNFLCKHLPGCGLTRGMILYTIVWHCDESFQTKKIELPSSKVIQMVFLTYFSTNISFMFLEIAGWIFISIHISMLGPRKFLSCAL